jgi:hypothetical protein
MGKYGGRTILGCKIELEETCLQVQGVCIKHNRVRECLLQVISCSISVACCDILLMSGFCRSWQVEVQVSSCRIAGKVEGNVEKGGEAGMQPVGMPELLLRALGSCKS